MIPDDVVERVFAAMAADPGLETLARVNGFDKARLVYAGCADTLIAKELIEALDFESFARYNEVCLVKHEYQGHNCSEHRPRQHPQVEGLCRRIYNHFNQGT